MLGRERRKQPGKWIYGPWIGNGRRRHRNRFWATLEEAKRYENPQPPPGGGGVAIRRGRCRHG